ncbi:MAG: hypothetical protein HQL65_15110 [Magnetococcales bacterium]|nr:hypothetical protein [Magnetococcales bacterium]
MERWKVDAGWRVAVERCPICRGTLGETGQCQRCGADLAPVFQARKQGRILLQQAVVCMVAGDDQKALELLRRAALWHRQPLIDRLLSLLENRAQTMDGLDHRFGCLIPGPRCMIV